MERGLVKAPIANPVLSAVLALTVACTHASSADDEERGAAIDAGVPQGRRDGAARDAEAQGLASKDAASSDAISGARDAGNSGSVMRASGRSAGCGKAASGNDAFEDRTLRVGSGERTYHVRVPASYDKDRAYALIFRFHGTGGNGLSGGLGVEYVAGQDMIVVAPDGLNGSWTKGSESSDLQLFDATYDELTTQYCVDLARVFAYGFSAGGGLSNTLGCKHARELRATAAIAGYDRADGSCKDMPIAAWFKHDASDPSVPIAQGESARDRALTRNACSRTTTMGESGCLTYDGCKVGYPVVWCETSGRGHDIWGDTAPALVWRFFSTLPAAGK